MPNPNPNITNFNKTLFGPWYFLKELFGRAKETDKMLNLSDGGHHENLGIYPLLKRRCRVIVAIRGLLGPRTLKALNRVEGVPPEWSKTRKAVAYIQLLAKEKDIETGELDGYWGPQTESAFGELLQVLVEGREPETWRPEDLPDYNPNGWPRQTPQ